jgi:hypothetical protein
MGIATGLWPAVLFRGVTMSRELSAEQMNPSGDSAAMSDSVENIRTLEPKTGPGAGDYAG